MFGVPTFRVDGDDELFWGSNDIEEAVLQEFLARAPLAQRRR